MNLRFLPLTLHHLWWIPTVVIYYLFYAYLSKLNNDQGLTDVVWYKSKLAMFTYLYGAIVPFWLIVSRISKDVFFDGMLYDNILVLSYVVGMWFLGAGNNFVTNQWIGVVFIIIGSILMRVQIR
jgi:hypothetical protein